MKLNHEKKKTILCFVLLIVCVVTLVVSITRLSDLPFHKVTGVFKSATQNKNEMNAVLIDGEKFLPREDLSVYLIIGLDKDGEMKRTDGYVNSEQSDFLTLMIIDRTNSTYSFLNVNRDTIAKVPRLGVFGDKVGEKAEQLALAHTYGDGMEISCRNTVNAVSGFLYGARIDGYFCITMSAVPVLNDFLGGVPVTFDKDYTELDPAFIGGTTLKMSGQQAYTFNRARASANEPTNVARMARQRLYIESAVPLIGEKASAASLLDVLTDLSPYLLTNYDLTNVDTMSKVLSEYRFTGSETPAGESKVENGYMAFYADEDALKAYVKKTFYEKYD